MDKLADIICFDTEMAEEQRLLELSVFDDSIDEIYHSYYNPGNIKVWHEEIHHITPQMVRNAPRFSQEAGKVQSIINGARFIVGCAIRNDINALYKWGIKGWENKTIIEIQEWFWLLRGVQNDESLFRARSLLSIAEEMGVNFNEDVAHGATADTRATIQCFLALKKELEEKYSDGLQLSIQDAVRLFNIHYADARREFLRKEAKGFVQLLFHGEYYSLKFNQRVEKVNSKCVEMIEVNDRYIAEVELRKLFSNRSCRSYEEFYKLRPSDIDKFKRYKNEFDEERSSFCKRFTSHRVNKSALNVLFK